MIERMEHFLPYFLLAMIIMIVGVSGYKFVENNIEEKQHKKEREEEYIAWENSREEYKKFEPELIKALEEIPLGLTLQEVESRLLGVDKAVKVYLETVKTVTTANYKEETVTGLITRKSENYDKELVYIFRDGKLVSKAEEKINKY